MLLLHNSTQHPVAHFKMDYSNVLRGFYVTAQSVLQWSHHLDPAHTDATIPFTLTFESGAALVIFALVCGTNVSLLR